MTSRSRWTRRRDRILILWRRLKEWMHLPVKGKTEQIRGEFPRMMTNSKMVHQEETDQEEMEWKMYIV